MVDRLRVTNASRTIVTRAANRTKYGTWYHIPYCHEYVSIALHNDVEIFLICFPAVDIADTINQMRWFKKRYIYIYSFRRYGHTNLHSDPSYLRYPSGLRYVPPRGVDTRINSPEALYPWIMVVRHRCPVAYWAPLLPVRLKCYCCLHWLAGHYTYERWNRIDTKTWISV